MPIDPDYAQDHDDAVSMLREDDGYRAFVHIADVGHYVDPGSAIDDAAESRSVTTYLGDEETRHMLPKRLAQEICSLKPDRDRLAHTVEFKLDEDGEIINDEPEIYKSVVKSDARLTYKHADSVIESADEILEFHDKNSIENEEAKDFKDMAESLKYLDEITEVLEENREDQSLKFNKRYQDISGRIVEEMMIQANMQAGDYVRENAPGIYRAHPTAPGWTIDAAKKLEGMGYDVPDEIHETPKSTLNQFFEQRVKDNDFEDARKAVVTSLERAVYEASDSGHVWHDGLGMEDYMHFTSPIRRYTDLINHWIIDGVIEGDMENLSRIAEHVSDRQEKAEKASLAWDDEGAKEKA